MSNSNFTTRIQTARFLLRAMRSIAIFFKEEWRRGTLMTNLKGLSSKDIEEENRGVSVPSNAIRLSEVYAPRASTVKPKTGYNKQDMCLILYTSGTSGRRKGVVYRYYNTTVKKLCIMSNIILNADDVCYTPLALIHGNALFLTVSVAMGAKATVALSRKFSASKFWEEVRAYNATTLGERCADGYARRTYLQSQRFQVSCGILH